MRRDETKKIAFGAPLTQAIATTVSESMSVPLPTGAADSGYIAVCLSGLGGTIAFSDMKVWDGSSETFHTYTNFSLAPGAATEAVVIFPINPDLCRTSDTAILVFTPTGTMTSGSATAIAVCSPLRKAPEPDNVLVEYAPLTLPSGTP